MKNKAKLKQAVYRSPLPGRNWVLLGGIMMLLWALWEGVTRVDAMDGMTKAYFNLARSQGTPLTEAIRIIWETPAARKDWLNIAYLALIALAALFMIAVHRRWTPGFLVIPLCAGVFFFHTSHLPLVQAFNLFEALKVFSCGLTAFGAGTNIAAALSRRRAARKKLSDPQSRRDKTLIPERKPRTQKENVRTKRA